jgi:hypothetical protein
MTGIHQEANCTQEMTPINFLLRIVPEFLVIPGVTQDTTMGFAIRNHSGVPFCRVRAEAVKFGVEPDKVLGPVIAHEIGHLLG